MKVLWLSLRLVFRLVEAVEVVEVFDVVQSVVFVEGVAVLSVVCLLAYRLFVAGRFLFLFV